MAATVEIEVRERFILVRQTGALNADEAMAMQAKVDHALADAHLNRVVFDNRLTQAPSEDIRKSMHAWVTAPDHFERAALVLDSDLLKVGVNMDALSKGLRMKAFNDIEKAIAWVAR